MSTGHPFHCHVALTHKGPGFIETGDLALVFNSQRAANAWGELMEHEIDGRAVLPMNDGTTSAICLPCYEELQHIHELFDTIGEADGHVFVYNRTISGRGGLGTGELLTYLNAEVFAARFPVAHAQLAKTTEWIEITSSAEITLPAVTTDDES
ncbi:MAG TPA: hypothetical protein VLG92_03040 [Candidatus Saccharimonadia bacterium]|nr:hypothetical protein [Candidatus Saccharimonadia bacterium]